MGVMADRMKAILAQMKEQDERIQATTEKFIKETREALEALNVELSDKD